MTRQYIIAVIVGLILVTSLGIGGFPPATALALTLTGATVILMMGCTGWPREGIMLRGGATDWTGELDALINLARLRGYYVRVAADGIFDVEEKLTGRCVCHGTAAQVRRWLRENTGEETDNDCGHFRNGGANSNRQYFRQTDDDEGPQAQPLTPLGSIRMSAISTILPSLLKQSLQRIARSRLSFDDGHEQDNENPPSGRDERQEHSCAVEQDDEERHKHR
jgi:hypothetical protein